MKRNLIVDSISGNYIPYIPELAKLIGSNAMIVLSELCNTYAKFNYEEFYETQEQICENTALGIKEVRNAVEILEFSKIISTDKRGLPLKRYFTINDERLAEIYNERINVEEMARLQSITKGNCNLLRNGMDCHYETERQTNTLSISNSNELSISNDISKTDYRQNKERDERRSFDEQNILLPEENLVRIADSNKEVLKVLQEQSGRESEVEERELEGGKNTSAEENFEENFYELFSSPVGTDKKSRLAQTVNALNTPARELFDYWNSKKLRVHKMFQVHYLERLTKILQKYTLEEVKHFIDNYETVVHDKNFYWTYIWDLQDFIDTKEERYLRFADGGDIFENYKADINKAREARKTLFHNETYNQAIKEGKDIQQLDREIAEERRKLRSSPKLIKL